MHQKFDVFLSHKSEDHTWVKTLKEALERRGVTVWLDQDEIRPGDRFVWALEQGLEASGAVVLVITPESLKSDWVADEYSRALALANDGQLQLIPVLLRDAKLPGFLSNRQCVDFRDPSKFEESVDRLIWPGLTGKQVIWAHISDSPRTAHWGEVISGIEGLGVKSSRWYEVYRSKWWIDQILEDSSKRLVLMCDIFESEDGDHPNSTQKYVELILEYRGRTKDLPNEIVFVFCHYSDDWDKAIKSSSLDRELVERFRHYFALDENAGSKHCTQLLDVWHKIQRDLMRSERFSKLLEQET